MINERYRLISPKRIQVDFVDEKIKATDIVIRPKYLSICAADQRYFQGTREQAVLNKKLPMCLIHEATGEVVFDPSGQYKQGTNVVLIPNTPVESSEYVRENYLRSSRYRSSGYDGFMQQLVVVENSRVIPFTKINPKVAVLLELMSVAMNAYDNFSKLVDNKKVETLGVWGNGGVGFVMSLVLKKMIPSAKLYVMGIDEHRLHFFSFADAIYKIDELPEGFTIDHGFECVGGQASSSAINQMIDIIEPQGVISLLGVSEMNVEVNTRMVLEKGLTLIGHSRSGYEDFKRCIELMEEYPEVSNYLETIISNEIVVRSIDDMNEAFNIDRINEFKTIMKWEV